MIVVLNFGSQFAHLIARRVRDMGVKSEILPFDASAEEILAKNPKGIILSGGPASVLEKGSPRPARGIFDLGIPILGICYGEQVMAEILGGRVVSEARREFGKEAIRFLDRKNIFSGTKASENVWFSHGDQVIRLPRGFARIASSKNCRNAAICNKYKFLYGVQFHPEVAHTLCGNKILGNFVFGICGAGKNWKVESSALEIKKALASEIKDGDVLMGLSGGVDSLVAATILKQVIGRRLHAVFVDTGLLQKGETEKARMIFKKACFADVRFIDASRLFLGRLRGVSDPEDKRKIIGHTFIDVFERAAKDNLKKYDIKYFAQGTIYPDRIESTSSSKIVSKIKTHHNLAIPEKFKLKIIEPLKDLYKDEVRILGEALGLPKYAVWKHPFPGPGLAIRIVGEINKVRLAMVREADGIFIEELQRSREYDKIWQAFAVLLPLRTTGVMGDARTYEYMISLRAVDCVDTMTVDWHKFPHELLEKISNRIVREVRGVNRVVYDISQKPPATIEYE